MLCYAMWQALPSEGSVDLAITRQALEPACFYIQTTSIAALGFKTTRLTKAAHNGRRRGKAGTTDVGSLRPTCTCQWGERSTAGPVSSAGSIRASPLHCFCYRGQDGWCYYKVLYVRNSFIFLGIGSARTWYVVRKLRRAFLHKCFSEDRTRGAVQNWTWPSLVPVAITPPCGKNVQQRPLVMGAKATGVFSSRAQILRSLSSATVARYKPSGEKHTDRRELMWTSLSSMTGSSWV